MIFFKHFIHLKPSEREAQLQGRICRHIRTARDVVNSSENGAIYDSCAIKQQRRPTTGKPQMRRSKYPSKFTPSAGSSRRAAEFYVDPPYPTTRKLAKRGNLDYEASTISPLQINAVTPV